MEDWFDRFAKAAFLRAADVAHDLKTPLNIAVLNLELLRMRVQKLAGASDEKVNEYSRSIEAELRRMARIFDAYFIYSVPPRADEPLEPVSLSEAMQSLDLPREWSVKMTGGDQVLAHRSRLRDLLKLLVEGAAKIFLASSVVVTTSIDAPDRHLRFEGAGSSTDADFDKLFKFYYTDASGNPEIALATARLIAETYGGTLTLCHESGNRLVLDLKLPAADRKNES